MRDGDALVDLLGLPPAEWFPHARALCHDADLILDPQGALVVKIPDLPGNYRPGDVVNGHVLTPRGHWVPVENAPSDARPRRYLDSQVSTVRSADAPSPVSRQAPHEPPPTAAPAPGAYAPAPAAAHPSVHATPSAPAPLPPVRATPSASRPVTGPPPASPSQARSATGKIAALAVAAIIGFQVLMTIGRTMSSFSEPAPWEHVDRYWEQLEVFDSTVTHWEVWDTSDGTTGYLIEVSPTDASLEPGESAVVELELTAYNDDGELVATAYTAGILSHEDPERVVGEFFEGDDLGITDLAVMAISTGEVTDP